MTKSSPSSLASKSYTRSKEKSLCELSGPEILKSPSRRPPSRGEGNLSRRCLRRGWVRGRAVAGVRKLRDRSTGPRPSLDWATGRAPAGRPEESLPQLSSQLLHPHARVRLAQPTRPVTRMLRTTELIGGAGSGGCAVARQLVSKRHMRVVAVLWQILVLSLDQPGAGVPIPLRSCLARVSCSTGLMEVRNGALTSASGSSKEGGKTPGEHVHSCGSMWQD